MKGFWIMVIVLTLAYIIYYGINIFKDLRVKKGDTEQSAAEEFAVDGTYKEEPRRVSEKDDSHPVRQSADDGADVPDPFAVAPGDEHAPVVDVAEQIARMAPALQTVPVQLFNGISPEQLACELNDPVRRAQSNIQILAA